MNSTISGILRAALSLVGAILLGKNLLGQEVNEQLWQEITGVVMGLVSMVWSFLDKTSTLESFQGVIRQAITFVGGMLVAAGMIKPDTLTSILGVFAAIAGPLYAWLSKKKTQGLADGSIPLGSLKK